MKNKILHLGILTVIVIAGILPFNHKAEAARMNIPRNVCALAVFPYFPSATPLFGSAMDPWINILSSNVCKNHLTIPNSTPFITQSYTPNQQNRYVVESNDVQIKAGAEEKKGPIARHIHRSYNDSLEDNFYYEHFVAKFAIDFGPDLKANANIPEITCNTPYPNPAPSGTPSKSTVNSTLGDCNGYLAGLWGGTRVTKSNNGIIWEFGLDGEFPKIFGQNPSLDPLIGGGFDSRNQENRKFEASINIPTKNINSPTGSWSATTTSRVLLRDFAIRKTTDMNKLTQFCSTAGDYTNGWCSLPPLSGYQTETLWGRPYYWFPIGTVSTVWKTPEPEPQECLDLSVTPAGPLGEAGLPQRFNVSPSVQGNLNLAYRWEANQNGVISFDNRTFTGTPYIDTTTSTNVEKVGTNPLPHTLVLTVTAVNADDTSEVFAQRCRQQIRITPEDTPPPPELACLDLTVTPAGPLDESGLPQSFNISSQVQGDLTLAYRWEANQNGVVSFDNRTFSGTPYVDTTNSTTVRKIGTNPLPYALVLTVTAVNADNTNEVFAQQCRQQIRITPEDTPPPPELACLDLTVTPAGPLDESGLPQTFNVSSQVQGNLTLAYRWQASQNGVVSFDNQTFNGSPYIDTTTQAIVRRVGTNPLTSNLTLTVTAVNGANTSQVFPQCRRTIIIQPEETPPPASECVATNLTSSGGNPLDENEASILQSSGTLNIGGASANVAYFRWETTAGSFQPLIQNPTFAFCSAFGFDAYPRMCTPLFTGGPAGTVVRATAIVQNGVPSTNPQCTKTITVQQPAQPEAVCREVRLTSIPEQLNPNGTTELRAQVIFDRPGNYTATIGWDGNNGNFDRNSQTGSTSGNATINYPGNNFTTNDANASARVFVSNIVGARNTFACQQGMTIETPDYECEDIDVVQEGNSLCLRNLRGGYTGSFTVRWGNSSRTIDAGRCVNNVPPGTAYEVFATDERQNPLCQRQGQTIASPPEIWKGVSLTGNANSYRNGATTIQATQERVYYQIVFNPSAPRTSAIMKDTISDNGGILRGQLLPSTQSGGTIQLESMTVSQQGRTMQPCSLQTPRPGGPSNCYEGTLASPSGLLLVRVDNPVTIEYTGRVNSALENPGFCENQNNVCQEQYFNQARAEGIRVYAEPNDDGTPSENFISFSNIFSPQPVILNIYCQYILTRAAGDIFLENDLSSGIDIRQCSDFRSTTGVIITPGTPDTPDLVSTGAEDQIFTVNHELCTQGQGGTLTGDLANLYGQGISENLSSQICEVRLRTGSPWRQEIITNSIEENKTRASRWEPDVVGTNANIFTLTSLTDDKDIYHVKDGDLIIDDYTLFDGEGTKTFIVENGDLIINGNIKYGACNKTDGPCTVRDIASLAFIVLNGNVSIAPDVTEIAGVYYVQEGARNPSGRLYSTNGANSPNQLTVYGSIYGDIDPLFTNRSFAGDPSRDEGGILIRFDQRVILNTPQGLRDILNLDLSQVAR